MEPKETKIGQTKIDNQLVADASLALDNENQMHLTVEIKVSFLAPQGALVVVTV